jgi:hypothetical protein
MKILFLAANPQETVRLKLAEEARKIENSLKRSRWRNEFQIVLRWEVRPEDIQRVLLEEQPEIVHFSGHGEGQSGLVLVDDSNQPKLVSAKALAKLFSFFTNRVRCVFLNACYAEVQAEAIVLAIDYVIGMKSAVRDDVAIAFAVSFYEALGAGWLIEEAFSWGCTALQLQFENISNASLARKLKALDFYSNLQKIGFQSHEIPILKKRATLGVKVSYTDPKNYTGAIWTHIIPEPTNVDKQHLIVIDWGGYQWQNIRILPARGLLLSYQKINQDESPRVITVSPLGKKYGENSACEVSNNTEILNGNLQPEPQSDVREEINTGWRQIDR